MWLSLLLCCGLQAAALRGKVRFIFIESICNDPDILQQNCRNKMLYSPDYQGVTTEQVGAHQTADATAAGVVLNPSQVPSLGWGCMA